jgi:hypothetical protein
LVQSRRRQILPANTGNTAPFLVFALSGRELAFLTSDDDELAAQSAAYQVLQTSSIYSQGLHYFDVNISASCH